MEVTKINYTVKNDVIFRFLFSDKEILKNFLEVVLEKDVTDIEVANQFSLNKVRYEEKIGILDIKACINNNEIIDLEKQRNAQSYYQKRIILYASNLVSKQLKSGNNYADLKDVTIINILDHVMFPEIKDIHTVWTFRERKNPECMLHNGLEVHYIELPKFRKSNPDFDEKLNQWLALIDTENEEWLEEAMESNKDVKEAKNKVDEFIADDETKLLIELKEKWQRDYNASMDYAKKTGLEDGMKEGLKQGQEQGLQEGIQEGRQQGLQQGIKQGADKEKLEIAKKLIVRDMNIKDICDITGLSEDEIMKIK